MDDKTPEDVAFEKLIRRSGKAYDRAMPEADTTFGKMKPQTLPHRVPPGTTLKDFLSEKPGSAKEDITKKLPDRIAPGATLEDFAKERVRPRKNIDLVPMSKGGKVSSASKRADGIAQRGKTKGTMIMCGGGYTKGK